MDYAAVVFTMIGSILIARKKWTGYILFMLANALWIPWSVVHGHFSITVMNLMYLTINIYGVRKWTRTTYSEHATSPSSATSSVP